MSGSSLEENKALHRWGGFTTTYLLSSPWCSSAIPFHCPASLKLAFGGTSVSGGTLSIYPFAIMVPEREAFPDPDNIPTLTSTQHTSSPISPSSACPSTFPFPALLLDTCDNPQVCFAAECASIPGSEIYQPLAVSCSLGVSQLHDSQPSCPRQPHPLHHLPQEMLFNTKSSSAGSCCQITIYLLPGSIPQYPTHILKPFVFCINIFAQIF